jgi:hypothetical protein
MDPVVCDSCGASIAFKDLTEDDRRALEDQHRYQNLASELQMLLKVQDYYKRHPNAETQIKPHFLRVLESNNPAVKGRLCAGVPFSEIDLPPEELPIGSLDTSEDAEVVEYLQHHHFALGPRMEFISQEVARFKSSVPPVKCPRCQGKEVVDLGCCPIRATENDSLSFLVTGIAQNTFGKKFNSSTLVQAVLVSRIRRLDLFADSHDGWIFNPNKERIRYALPSGEFGGSEIDYCDLMAEAASNSIELLLNTETFVYRCPVFISNRQDLDPGHYKAKVKLAIADYSEHPDVEATLDWHKMIEPDYLEADGLRTPSDYLLEAARKRKPRVGDWLPIELENEEGNACGAMLLAALSNKDIFKVDLVLYRETSDIRRGMRLLRAIVWQAGGGMKERVALIGTIESNAEQLSVG